MIQPTYAAPRQRVPRSQAQRRIAVLRRCSPGAFVVYVMPSAAASTLCRPPARRMRD